MKRIYCLLLFTCLIHLVSAQKIRIKVLGQKDTTVHLFKYFGQSKYYADTAEMKNGEVVFDGKKQVPGMLGLLLPEQKNFEFIYNNEDIHLETASSDYVKNMKVKKSEENRIFIAYVNFITEKRVEMNKLSEERGKYEKKDDAYKIMSDKIEALDKEVASYQKNLISQHPLKLVGKIVKMTMDITIPESPRDINGKEIDPDFRFKYYRSHFWDNVDLSCDALVNNQVFHNKLEFYFGKSMMYQYWDTIIPYAFDFCDRLEPKSKMFEYCVGWITSNFGKSDIMGMDKVYLYMVNRYYCSINPEGKSPAFWIKDDKIKEICDNIDNKIKLVVGSKPPNLILLDSTDTKWYDMYDIDAEYTILYFWDPECGHCKTTTPKLNELYVKKLRARNVEVFAVGKAIDKDFENWKKFIRDKKLEFINVAFTDKLYKLALKDPNSLVPVPGDPSKKPTTLESLNYHKTYDISSTPVIYLLDKDKKIIAKRLGISQIEDMLDHLQNKKDEPKLFPPNKEEDEQMQQKH